MKTKGLLVVITSNSSFCQGRSVLTLIGLVALLLAITACSGPSSKTTIEKNGKDWVFKRNGENYHIKGAGGHQNLEKLQQIGGNSIRTWSLDNAKEILDNAHKNGISVMLGLWVGHERHGFDYDDKEAVAKQLAKFTEAIPKFKDHPALLCWAVGNEVDLAYTNTKVWNAVQDIAAMIKEKDPFHPVTTVTAGLDSQEVQLIMERCPAIDFYSINTYGNISDVPKNLSNYGWKGPYMITEWGPNGHWEVEKTTWGAPIEQTSTEKASSYRNRYQKYIAANKSTCLGSYVFLWGQKQETTSTWYGLFTEEGRPTEVIDELELLWKGDLKRKRAPKIESFILNNEEHGAKNLRVDTLQECIAKIEFSEKPEGASYFWEVAEESTDIKSGGDKESKPKLIQSFSGDDIENELIFKAPKKGGAYRLFFKIISTEGKVSYANFPFYVEE